MVQLVSAAQAKNLPGRPKTDKLDAMWLARLTEMGLLRASFVPPRPAPDRIFTQRDHPPDVMSFLYGFKGAPSARHAYGRNRQRELARATGGEQSGQGAGDKRQGSPGVSPLRGGSFRRALRAEALRRDELPRTAAPAPAAAGPRRHAPMPRHMSRARPSRSRQVRRSPYEGHSHRAGTPRIVQVGPSSVKGTPRSFLTRPRTVQRSAVTTGGPSPATVHLPPDQAKDPGRLRPAHAAGGQNPVFVPHGSATQWRMIVSNRFAETISGTHP